MATPIRPRKPMAEETKPGNLHVDAHLSLDGGHRQYAVRLSICTQSWRFSGELPLELWPPPDDMDIDGDPVPA
jgi:hypothetical protein